MKIPNSALYQCCRQRGEREREKSCLVQEERGERMIAQKETENGSFEGKLEWARERR